VSIRGLSNIFLRFRLPCEVANVLGAGYLEKVYERALIHELALRGVSAKDTTLAARKPVVDLRSFTARIFSQRQIELPEAR
jgi:hypothetical protein